MMKLASTPGFLSLLAVAAFSTSLVACIIEDGPPRRLTNDQRVPEGSGTGTVGSSGGSSSGTSGTTDPGTTTTPLLAVIDTDQVMTADPGQGVGVFIEYAKGGKWHVWWTCDTQQTNQDCQYVVSATASAGNIENVDAAQLQGGGTTSTPTASRVEARSTTTNQVHGITFTTNPGAVITVEASVGGIKDGKFLFFVQKGKVNGGFTGKITNPLQLQGDVP